MSGFIIGGRTRRTALGRLADTLIMALAISCLIVASAMRRGRR